MFTINNATCQMGKISNNLEKHGDEDVPAWTIPIIGVLIDAAALEALLHDEHASMGFFERNEDNELVPRPWLTYADPIKLTEAYDGMATTIKLGDELLEFDRCRLKNLTIGRFYSGGLAQIDCNLQLYPGLDHANLVLQEFQTREIFLTVADAKVAAKKKSKQQELPLGQPSERPAEAADTGRLVGADDPLYNQAVAFVRESRITSVDGVQMQLKIDHARASLIMGAMELLGIVGPVRDDNSREILDSEPPRATDDAPEGEEENPVEASGMGRQITAHAKRQARKRAKNSEATTQAH